MNGEIVAGRPYHHGDLQRTLLAAAVAAIGESGPAALSLRDLARRAGVSHAAPTHHFGDKAGLLTVLATQGFHLLADELSLIRTETGSLLEIGVGLRPVRRRAPGTLRGDVPPGAVPPGRPALLVAARQRATEGELQAGVATRPQPPTDGPDARVDRTGRLVDRARLRHAWLSGALPTEIGDDPAAAGRAVIRRLFAVR